LADVLDGLSADCIAADAKYNEGVGAWTGGWEKLEGQKAFIGDPDTVTLAALRERRDAIQASELKLAQDAGKLTGEYVTREEARSADLKVHVENCEDKLTTTEESVVKKLRAAGISVESQPAYESNVEAAKRTFTHRVHESADWKAANAKLSEARATHQASVEAVTAGRLQVAKANAYLYSLVTKLAGC
jgi:hypothetical protein